ncbi:MAG: hypothetical protein ACI4SF_13615 [Oscillospiraceae bacterium]
MANREIIQGLPIPLSERCLAPACDNALQYPEGMAVGAVYAGLIYGSANITAAGTLALSVGITIQNFPEEAIISVSLWLEGMTKRKSFACGVISGAAEPLGTILTILVAGFIVPAMSLYYALL